VADMVPCYVYVDGAYVRRELRDHGQSDEFNPRNPARFVQNQRISGAKVTPSRVFYYDAIDPQADQAERERQRQYFARLEKLPDTHVVLGEVRRGTKKREQKGVDVQLAIDALRAATAGVAPVVALVTGDADFAPLARAIREVGPHVIVLAFSQSLSENLAREADRVQVWEHAPTDWDLGRPE
jgi:uncharacterized LabA/DUF88 family protein